METIAALQTIDWRNILSRAFWTFIQAFVAVFLIAGESMIDLIFSADWANLWVLLLATAIAGLSAGLSAVKTIIVELIRELGY